MSAQSTLAAPAPAPDKPVGLDVVPRINAGFRLQWEAVQDCHVLLYPEGMVKLSQTAGEILKRCDGQHSLAEIVAQLEAAFATTDLGADVLAFVQVAGNQRWLTWAGR